MRFPDGSTAATFCIFREAGRRCGVFLKQDPFESEEEVH